MTTIDKIRAEIERLKSKYRHNGLWTSSFQSDLAMAKIESMNELLSFLDTLPDESEQPTRGYDEAYLNEKIAKASKSWEGVDVDKFMDEIRGREPITTCNELAEAAMNYIAPIENEDGLKVINFSGRDIKDAFIAGAEWGANHLRDTTKMMGDELEEIAENIYKVPFGTRAEDFKAGAEWQKRKMIGEAYEEEVQEVYRDDDGIHCCVSVGTDYKPGTIVYVITIPKEGEQ